MAGYEQTIIVGHVGRVPEMRSTQNGASVTSFSVAVTTRWTDKQSGEKRERTNWYNVSCWNRLAEIANQYVTKGTQIMIVGTVEARAYMAQDGEARASLDLRADSFQLLSGGDATNNSNPAPAPEQNTSDIPF